MKFNMQNIMFGLLFLFCLVGSGVTWVMGDHKTAEGLFGAAVTVVVGVALFLGWDE